LLRGLLEFCWSAGEEHPPVAVAASDLPESVRNFGALKILAAQGLVVVEDRPAPPTDGLLCAAAQICATPGAPQLTDEQAAAWAQLEPALPTSKTAQPSAGEKAFLLHGITGSGKTELYLLALEKTLEAGRTGIVLVPEISLTPQTARRFYARLSRFGIAVLHSRQTDGERAAAWRRVRNHEVRVVVGPRSALFAPLERLGLIVIDEEHETAFKQESAPRYQTRDAARRRAADCGATLILGSATPSLEAYHGSKIGELRRLTLTRRVAGRPLPNTLIVDMNAEMRELKYATSFSRALRVAIGETLAKGEQTLLFLNRRGFAPVVICAKCRHVERCEFCDVAATFHRARQILRCHYCAAERPLPKICPACGAAHLKQLGAGTERVEDELKRLFPSARIARMDADSTVRRSTWAEILDAFQAGDIDVLIGTQMIAKGLDFPNVTLAAVVSADTALHLPDFRARERTFQLLTQVAGRTGRGPKGGRAFIQTHRPTDQAVLTAARHDFDTFATGELQERKMFGYPPFSRLARVLFRATDAARAATAAQEARQMLEPDARALGLRILGPSPAPLSRIENWNRFHLLLKTPVIETPKHHAEYALGDKNPLSELFCSTAAKKMERISGVEVAIDIDPQSLL
jgi:primosomal protein N' (replication factor Y)